MGRQRVALALRVLVDKLDQSKAGIKNLAVPANRAFVFVGGIGSASADRGVYAVVAAHADGTPFDGNVLARVEKPALLSAIIHQSGPRPNAQRRIDRDDL